MKDLAVGTLFRETARDNLDKTFIQYPDRALSWSYGDFLERVDKLSKGLLEIGIRKGDHIGVWARNVPDWLTFFFASAQIGAVLITVNTLYKKHELDYILRQSDMKVLALVDSYQDSDYLGIIYELVPELSTAFRGELSSSHYPFLEKVIYIGQKKHKGMYNTNELLLLGEHASDTHLERALQELDPDDVVNMQYTSGTTGFPKGVMLSSRNILQNGYSIGRCQGFGPEDRLCLPVPLFHCFGIVLGVLAVLSHSASLVMVESFDALAVLEAVEDARCTALYGVPTMFSAELAHPAFRSFDLTSLRTGIMAGSLCPRELMDQVMEKMHMDEITIAYGLTEASPVITQTDRNDPAELRCRTVGRALEGVEVKIIDPETGKDLPPGEVGELCCRGYNVMKGYYRSPEETDQAIDGDAWLHSGDLASVDEQGYYQIRGRMKDMIIRGGENIYPREVESFLEGLPGVRSAQVVGLPDKRYGELVVAYILIEDGFQPVEEDLRQQCRENLARYKVPKYVVFTASFPQTASGKVRKAALREDAVQRFRS